MNSGISSVVEHLLRTHGALGCTVSGAGKVTCENRLLGISREIATIKEMEEEQWEKEEENKESKISERSRR